MKMAYVSQFIPKLAGPAPTIAPEDGQAAALAPLPVEGLRLTPDAITLLKRLGLKRIGQLCTSLSAHEVVLHTAMQCAHT